MRGASQRDKQPRDTNPKSLDDLRRELKKHPKKVSLWDDLADALIDRYLLGEGEGTTLPGRQADLKELTESRIIG
jgi:hypothetical protein